MTHRLDFLFRGAFRLSGVWGTFRLSAQAAPRLSLSAQGCHQAGNWHGGGISEDVGGFGRSHVGTKGLNVIIDDISNKIIHNAKIPLPSICNF